MLVLSRKVTERILIGDDVVIQVVAIDGSHKVRIGIIAPKEIRVDREEVAAMRKGLDGTGGTHVDHA